MKVKTKALALSLILCLSSVFSSCALLSTDETDTPQTDIQNEPSTNDEKIKDLEAQIITLLQSHQLSESEQKKEISALKAEIEVLKKGASQTESESASETSTPKIFNYTLSGYKATITSINTNEESISIPAVIDGHAVVGIGSGALSSSTVKKIVIEDGIESLDWFAFKGCSSLSSISLPPSITSIGYGAFDGASKSFTIECQKDSFAMKYAQSYGLNYNLK